MSVNANDPSDRARRTGFRVSVARDYELLTYRFPSRLKRLLVATTNRGFHAVLLYRVSNWCFLRQVPLVPLVLTRLAQLTCAVDIAHTATLGPGIVIFHGIGIVIGSEARIDGDCRIFHGVTLGDRGSEWIGSGVTDGHPHVGRNCVIGAGAKLLGPIRVGDNSVIGANAVVVGDLAPNSIAGGIPARVIGKRPPMDARLRRMSATVDDVGVGTEAAS